jgi:pantoate--beta-alanine ligase
VEIASAVCEGRELFATLPRPLGFVPTMGALHEGHLELVRSAKRGSESVVVSIFVNPLQFGRGEDLERYPRDLEGDSEKLSGLGVDVLFTPSAQTLYPPGFSTYVDVGKIGTVFEGAARPTHFRGVTTVVAKLLNIVQPDALYLGQKDAQQTAVLRTMIRDLDVATRVQIVPTRRETDGLAMSSRNAYLSEKERKAAPSLYGALRALKSALENGTPKPVAIARASEELRSVATLDYFDVVDAHSFEPLDHLRPSAFVIGAARFGSTRLIDNIWIDE